MLNLCPYFSFVLGVFMIQFFSFDGSVSREQSYDSKFSLIRFNFFYPKFTGLLPVVVFLH